jgi:dCTP deaminase
MTLGTLEIKQRLNGEIGDKNDPLVIAPLPRDLTGDPDNVEQFEGSAIDLRLGTWFEVPRASALPSFDVLTQTDKDDEPLARHTKTIFKPFGSEFYLPPRQFVLASTLEWIRLPGDLSGTVTAKSSWGRRGLIIATAIAVHPYFTGCLTLELANVGEITIALRPGVKICQLSLNELVAKTPVPSEQSFAGFRRPVLAPIRLDKWARGLSARTQDA